MNSASTHAPIRHIPARCVFLFAGLSVTAFGVALSVKAALGTSPVSSLPFVLAAVSGLPLGTTTIFMNILFILLQVALLRRQFPLYQLLQLPASVVFGVMIDAASFVLQPLTCTSYLQQWITCIAGIVLVALGVSMEVTAGIITIANEGIVLTLSKVTGIKFSSLKMAFDISLVCISSLLSLTALGYLTGVREGTVATALCVGLLTRQFKKPLSKFEEAYLQ